MDSGPIDISSDEDEPSRPESDREDNFDWVSELLESVDEANGDDSDEVMVIGEVNSKPKSNNCKPPAADVDDDCMVLDGDPDKVVSIMEDPDSGSDELLVVGEKGQVACRDYPHPRHLCAKLPFSSTLHSMHCNLCHCYVCDSVAPCAHWGSGDSNHDHCHATDKEETWKKMRIHSKKGLPVGTVPKLGPPPPLDIIRLAPSSLSPHQGSRSTTIHPCSSLVRSRTMPTIRNPVRSHPPEFQLSKNRSQSCSVSNRLLGVHHNLVGRVRVPNVGNIGPQVVSSPSTFKRVRAAGGPLPVIRTSSIKSSSCTGLTQRGIISTPMATSNDSSWLNVQSGVPQNSSQPMATFIGSTVPYQPQTYGQPPPPPTHSLYPPPTHSQFIHEQGNQSQNDGQNIYQYDNQSQDTTPSMYQYGNQNQTSSGSISVQSNLGASVADFGFSDSNYSWVNNSSQSIQQPPIHQPPVQQPLIHQPPIQQPPIQQPPIQQPPIQQPQIQQPQIHHPQTQQPPIQQPPIQQPPMENSQIQSNGPSLVKEQSNDIPNFDGLNKEFESWLLDNQSVPAVANDSVPSHLNVLSPVPSFVETGTFVFDFETSWSDLAQV